MWSLLKKTFFACNSGGIWVFGVISTINLPRPLVTTEGDEVDFANNSQFILLDRELAEYTIVRSVEKKEK